MQIREMPASERPQEKLMFAGPGGLSNAELLALIIRTGTEEMSAVRLAEEVLSYAAENAGDLGMADVRELMSIHGIGTAKACSIVAAIELSKRLAPGRVMESKCKLSTGKDVYDVLMQEMMYEKRELFMSIHLNTRMEIESKRIVSIGCLDTAPVHPREVFRPAVKSGAAAIIVAHNHPSGDPAPSDQDIAITKRLIEASRIIGIKLLDHIIAGRDSYISLKDSGIIPK